MSKPDGGPSHQHLTVRDRFALEALGAMIGNTQKTNWGKANVKLFAMYAYEYADAMLEERTKLDGKY